MAALTPPRPLYQEDDRSQFDCGRPSLNIWFHQHAWRNQSAGLTRTTVICHPETGTIVGYVALCSAQITRAFLRKADRQNKPDPVPVTLLAQLAVDQKYQGRGYGADLLFYALTTAVIAANSVGSFAIITHPIDQPAQKFYAKYGFEPLPGDPKGTVIIRIADLIKSGIGK